MRVRRMVNPVVGRRHQDIFQDPEFADQPGMNKKGVETMNKQYADDHFGRETDNGQYRPKARADNGLEDGYPCRDGIVKIFALVMNHMRCPEDIDLMSKAMVPIPGKVGAEEKRHPEHNRGLDGK